MESNNAMLAQDETIHPQHPGLLVVLAATSGTGKTTVSHELVKKWPRAIFSVSYTTRAPRSQEHDGEDYHFISREQFQQMIAQDEFLEWAQVHDNFYGTGKQITHQLLASGHDILLDIDVQGAHNVRKQFGDRCVLIFLLPPSWDVMLQRLRGRNTDNETEIAKRLQTARHEMPLAQHFDFVVVNEDLQQTVDTIITILQASRYRTSLMHNHLAQLLATMP